MRFESTEQSLTPFFNFQENIVNEKNITSNKLKAQDVFDLQKLILRDTALSTAVLS